MSLVSYRPVVTGSGAINNALGRCLYNLTDSLITFYFTVSHDTQSVTFQRSVALAKMNLTDSKILNLLGDYVTDILHIVTDSNPRSGGVIEAARAFALAWARDGHRQDLLTLDAPGEVFLTDYPGKIFALGPPRNRMPWNIYRFSPKMVPWLKAHAQDYDAIIVSGLWRYQARGAWRALAGSKIPYLVFPHGMLDPWFENKYPLKHRLKQMSWWFAEGPLLASARAVLFTNEEERQRSKGAFWPYKVNAGIANLGISAPVGDPDTQRRAFRAAVPALGDRPFLLYLSRIHEKKGCDLLVEAFARVAHQQPGVDLVIAGPDQTGLTSVLKEQAAGRGVAGRIHFPGMMTGDAKIGAFREADAFVLPSHQENFGIVVVEALAVGTPVLISNQVYIWPEIVADEAGLVEPDTVEGTHRLLHRWFNLSESDRARLCKQATHSFKNRFDIKQAAQYLMELIEGLDNE